MWRITVVMTVMTALSKTYPEGVLPQCLQNDGFCSVELESILTVIELPVTGMGRQYILHEKTNKHNQTVLGRIKN
jgi:hypothetical protein